MQYSNTKKNVNVKKIFVVYSSIVNLESWKTFQKPLTPDPGLGGNYNKNKIQEN